MKKITQIAGIIAVILTGAGSLAKVMHWPGASIALVMGLGTLILAFTPIALINNYRKANLPSPLFHVVTYLTVFIIFTAVLFKIQHWPGTDMLYLIAFPFPFVVFIPTLLWYMKKHKQISIQQTISILLFMAYLSVSNAFLAVDFSKTLIDETLLLDKEYHDMQQHLASINGLDYQKKNKKHYTATAEAIKAIKNYVLSKEDQLHLTKNKSYSLAGIKEKTKYTFTFHGTEKAWANLNNLQHNLNKIYIEKLPNQRKMTQEKHLEPIFSASNYLDILLGKNPKLWTLTNLSFISAQAELHQYLHYKHINKDTPL